MEEKTFRVGYFYKRRRVGLEGFALVNTIILVVVIFLLIGYTIKKSDLLVPAVANRRDSVSSFFDAESRLVELCYDKDFSRALSKNFYWTLTESASGFRRDVQKVEYKGENINVDFYNSSPVPYVDAAIAIQKESKSGDVYSMLTGIYKFVRDDFVEGSGVIDCANRSPDFVDNLIERCAFGNGEFASFVRGVDAFDLHSVERVELETVSYTDYSIKSFIEGASSPFVSYFTGKTVSLFCERGKDVKTDVVFVASTSVPKLAFEGVMVINGDLIVEQDSLFRGILVLDGGNVVLENGASLTVEGLVISSNEVVRSDRFKVEYDYYSLVKFGCLLPNFVELKLFSVKE